MRELKFRVWNKIMRHYRHFVLQKGVSVSIGADLEIEQYTGLKEKNGKEIYEGDIILVANHGRTPYVVIYREWDCSFVCNNENLVDFVHMFKTMPQCYEVIGNIHENPEILDQKG